MKNKRILKLLFILSAASMLLPWFTYNARVTGYCWGFAFFKWFAVPMVLIGVYLFGFPQSKTAAFISELSVTANLVICVLVFGRWQETANIAGGFRWLDGFRTAQPGFWIAVSLFVLLFAVYQIDFGKWQGDGSGSAE